MVDEKNFFFGTACRMLEMLENVILGKKIYYTIHTINTDVFENSNRNSTGKFK